MDDHVCYHTDDFVVIKENQAKIEKTLYFGNGHPSIITQLAMIRQTLNVVCWIGSIVAGATIVQLVALAFSLKDVVK